MSRGVSLALASAGAGAFVWGAIMAALIENKRGGGALALGGRHY